MMKIDILTLFPGMFDTLVSHSIVKRAIHKRVVSIKVHDLRDFTHDRHRTCDDRPFGGGPGMLMKPEPIFEAVEKILGKKKQDKKTRLIYMTPQGVLLDQAKVKKLASFSRLIFLCGHYEGVDQRVIEKLVTDEISIGDYIVTGGELPAMVVADSVIRLLRGTLGSEASKEFETFSNNLLEYPQYTRPAVYQGLGVPRILLSGDHKAIEQWRKNEALKRTRRRRPDLLTRRSE
ncbi:MAG: tRNA (guanosine(37)-N1)-methyltransferase TrmD [Candidatus Omnitrophica bacterium CG1_02_49_16]|nr:MAG: tRNA (guanosine(37)-N1)-methyltransferase TrmD [Candidatus Omnitrophica bacterium CG1_02_49_16]